MEIECLATDTVPGATGGVRMYVPLHVHSEYSVLDGMAPVKKMVDKAVASGMPGLALTDHGVMTGVKAFCDYVYKSIIPDEIEKIGALQLEEHTLQKNGTWTPEESLRIRTEIQAIKDSVKFKPILGCEVYVARRSRHDKDPSIPNPYHSRQSIDRSGYHLILLAKNLIGYKNLIKMVSLGWIEGEYYRPRIDRELLTKYHEGIIATTACLGGEVAQHILHDQIDLARETILWYKELFGEDYYLEIQLHKPNPIHGLSSDTYDKQVKVAQTILELSKELAVKIVATNDTHFLNEEDADAHERLICLSTNQKISDTNRKMLYTKQEWLKTPEEMTQVFVDYPDVLENTLEVLEKIDIYSIDNPPLMPNFELPEGFTTENEYLRYLTYEGAKVRYGDPVPDKVRERLDFELDTVEWMGFPGYFLVVQDYIKAARDMGILVGPGRGSAAGSAVAYCLNITKIDPIKYNLLFERFLNPGRISLPDIDVDFENAGRAKILEWVTNKYGKDKVAHIITFGKMATKMAIKDVARVEDLPLSEANALVKRVPDKMPEGENKKDLSIEWMIRHDEEFKRAQHSPDSRMRNTITFANKLEGTIRNTGVHASGVIISGVPLSDVVALTMATDPDTHERKLVAQCNGEAIESMGLIKMDFLGLKNLDIIKAALINIRKNFGKEIDMDKIPWDDEKTFQLYSLGDTSSTFQFESPAMKKHLQALQPTKFEDLVAMNALYRPGPMKYIPDFINRKHGREKIKYDLPEMEPYLSETYGITVYQEQVMQLARKIGGFSPADSDHLRKAMGKKRLEEMEKYHVKFVEGGVERGYDREILEKIYADWSEFASYAFNKSHSVCYAYVAYQTGYLKANYPAQYMAAVLTVHMYDSAKLFKAVEETMRMNLSVKTPDVNESEATFSVTSSGDIRFGLAGIKGVGESAAEAIIQEREARGLYRDVFDFFVRINLAQCNRSTIESLILSGAFDCFGLARETYFTPVAGGKEDDTFCKMLITYAQSVAKEKNKPALSLFGEESASLPTSPTPPDPKLWSDIERLSKERDMIGVYLSAHPLDPYDFMLRQVCNVQLTDLERITECMEDYPDNIIVAGIVVKVQHGITKKKQDPYARITLENSDGTGEIALFGQEYVEWGKFAKEGLSVIIHISVVSFPYKSEKKRMKVDRIELLSEAEKIYMTQGVEMVIPLDQLENENVSLLVNEIQEHSGDLPLYVKLVDPTTHLSVSMKACTFAPGRWLSLFLDQPEIKDRGIECRLLSK